LEFKIDESFKVLQPLLMEHVLKALGFNEQTKPKEPAQGSDQNIKWDYRRILGQLNFLEKTNTRALPRIQGQPKSM